MTRRIMLALVLCALSAGGATAQPAGAGPFGIGIIIGEPTGIDAKYYLSHANAVEFAAAWSLESDNTFQIHGDYLFHNYDLIKVERGELPLFFGVGARVAFRENADDLIGIRFPVGLDYNFDGAPLDVFVQIVPILELAPSTDFELEGAIGARFFF
jgi:hypothetical protein